MAVVMTDPLAGLNQVVFPTTTDPGQSYDLDGVANATQAHGYDFVQADDFGGTVDVVVSDRAGNETTESFRVVNDTVAPTVENSGLRDELLVDKSYWAVVWPPSCFLWQGAGHPHHYQPGG